MVDFSFDGVPSGQSSVLARQLENAILSSGVPHQYVSVSRADGEHMDLGNIVQIASDLLQNASHSAEAAASILSIPHLAIILLEVCHRGKSGLTIVEGKKRIRISAQEIDRGNLDLLLASLKDVFQT